MKEKYNVPVISVSVEDMNENDIVNILKEALYEFPVDYIEFKTQSTHTNTQKTVYHNYSAEDVDYFATVYNNQCYIIPIEKIGSRSFRLRLKPTKNGQVKNINFAENFKLENTFIK